MIPALSARTSPIQLDAPGPEYMFAIVASRGGQKRDVWSRSSWLLRELGHTWTEIAGALGYASHSGARRAAERWERMRRKPNQRKERTE